MPRARNETRDVVTTEHAQTEPPRAVASQRGCRGHTERVNTRSHMCLESQPRLKKTVHHHFDQPPEGLAVCTSQETTAAAEQRMHTAPRTKNKSRQGHDTTRTNRPPRAVTSVTRSNSHVMSADTQARSRKNINSHSHPANSSTIAKT